MAEDGKKIIKSAGLRSTGARLSVLNVLISAKTALSHAEIIERLSDDYHYDRVTIYRVLEWLIDAHLIHRVPSDDRMLKFQVLLSKTSHQHAHLHCIKCHKIVCMDEIQPSLPNQITTQFQIESIDMIIKGRCSSCQD